MCTPCTPPQCVAAASSGQACSGSAPGFGASVLLESIPGSGMKVSKMFMQVCSLKTVC